jgi:dihydroxyacetone kinase-like protein
MSGMRDLDAGGTIAMLNAVAERMVRERDHLCALDGHVGDADHGVAMAQGFSAVRDALRGLDAHTATISEVFGAAAKSFLNAVGASSGPLYATAFMRAGKLAAGRAAMPLDEAPLLLAAMAEGVRDRGKAEIGDKTMIDAWAPAARAVEDARANGLSLTETLDAARAAATAGAEATKAMIAQKGRAARLGERSRGHVDPGAASAAMIVETMADMLGDLGRGD